MAIDLYLKEDFELFLMESIGQAKTWLAGPVAPPLLIWQEFDFSFAVDIITQITFIYTNHHPPKV